jgi:hypothetical protein
MCKGEPTRYCLKMESVKLSDITPVREYVEGNAVELRLAANGRRMLRAYNECGNNYVEIDLVFDPTV